MSLLACIEIRDCLAVLFPLRWRRPDGLVPLMRKCGVGAGIALPGSRTVAARPRSKWGRATASDGGTVRYHGALTSNNAIKYLGSTSASLPRRRPWPLFWTAAVAQHFLMLAGRRLGAAESGQLPLGPYADIGIRFIGLNHVDLDLLQDYLAPPK